MSKLHFTVPRGMRDIEAEEMAVRLWVSKRILETLRLYGFRLVEPSPIENLETLEAKCGPSIRDEIYWFEDKAGRKQGLRFDLTVGLARMVANHPDWHLPLKLCAFSNMWRYDEPQFGRYRCFYQWDAEIFGSPLAEADAEVIALSLDILEALGLKNVEARISSRKVAEGLLTELGIHTPGRLENVLRIVDKFRKQSRTEVESELVGIGLSKQQIEAVLKFASINGGVEEVSKELLQLVTKSPRLEEGIENLAVIEDSIEALGKIDRCTFDMSIVRGIGYYDGMVFEVFDKNCEEVGALVGGGRFDALCTTYGREVHATGAAGGIERLMLSLEKTGLISNVSRVPQVYIVTPLSSVRSAALRLAQRLRAEGISTDYDLKGRSLTKQLEHADSLKVPFVLITGTKEEERGVVKVRDMRERHELEVKLTDVTNYLRKKLSETGET
ncbi:MAG: histidine--tRNA ligase [Candidatus Bathyarchaeia archaeon]